LRLSITIKITGAILVTSLLVLGLGFGILAFTNIRNLREHLVAEALAIARLAGEYNVANLAFGAREESSRDLARLGQNPNVLAAALFDKRGEMFSKYRRSGFVYRPPARAHLEFSKSDSLIRVDEHHLEVFLAVLHQGERYGTIHLLSSTAPFKKRLQAHVVTMAASGGGLVLLSLLLALLLQRVISRPLRDLARVAGRISNTFTDLIEMLSNLKKYWTGYNLSPDLS